MPTNYGDGQTAGPASNGKRRSWEYPVCPPCGTDVLVAAREVQAHSNAKKWHCLACGELFDAPDPREAT